VADGDLVDRLTAHRTVGGAPREELEWVAAHGHLRRLKVGEILTAKAAGKVDGLFILLSGQLALHVERANARERVYVWHGGDISGILPYSRLTSPPGDSIVERDLELVMVSPADVAQLPHACPGLTAILVHAMVDRARQLTSSELQNEKMATLGKMSAWMAHDLNNPASAIGRSARALRTAASAADDHARALGALALTAEQRSVIDAVCRECLDTPGRAVLSPLQQADRENEVSDWLSDHNCDAADAEALADTALTRAQSEGGDRPRPQPAPRIQRITLDDPDDQ